VIKLARLKEKEMIPIIIWFLLVFLPPAFYTNKGESRFTPQVVAPGAILVSWLLERVDKRIGVIVLLWLVVDAFLNFPVFSNYLNPILAVL